MHPQARLLCSVMGAVFLCACEQSTPPDAPLSDSGAMMQSSSSVSSLPDTQPEWTTFLADPRIDFRTLGNTDELCGLSQEELNSNKTPAATMTVPVTWKEAGVALHVPWNPAWGTDHYKDAPWWLSDEMTARFGQFERTIEACDSLSPSWYTYINASTLGQAAQTLSNAGVSGTRSTVGTRNVLEYASDGMGGLTKNILVEIPFGTMTFIGKTDEDIALFKKMIESMKPLP